MDEDGELKTKDTTKTVMDLGGPPFMSCSYGLRRQGKKMKNEKEK
jgi:hypothetical protein